MDKRLLELSVDIVHAQASLYKMSGEEIETSLVVIYNTLNKIQQAESEGKSVIVGDADFGRVAAEPESSIRSDPRSSIQEDKVICMECGAEFRQLTANHLKSHGLTPREYKRKWGFPLKQPLAAKTLTSLRSRSAKKRGLPQKLQQYLDNKREGKRVAASEGVPVMRTGARTAARRSTA